MSSGRVGGSGVLGAGGGRISCFSELNTSSLALLRAGGRHWRVSEDTEKLNPATL